MPERNNITIRPARLDDVLAVARVHVESWRATYRGIVPNMVLDNLREDERASMWRRALDNSVNPVALFVAEADDGRITGFAAAGPDRTGNTDYTGEVYAIYLDEPYQGAGTGRNLLEACAQSLLDMSHRSMLIWTLSQNPACGFYRRLGGEAIATQEVQIGGKTLEETAFGWHDLTVLVDRGEAGRSACRQRVSHLGCGRSHPAGHDRR
jgi:GNAT superfamily N-acetyltransferase